MLLNMCIVSDVLILEEDQVPSYIKNYTWNESQNIELSSFSIVVLDMQLDEDSVDSNINRMPHRGFLSKREDIMTIFLNGGLIVCLTHNTQDNKGAIPSNWHYKRPERAEISRHNETRNETSYDWLNESFAGSLGFFDFDTNHSVSSRLIKLLSKEIFTDYFNDVKVCYKPLKGFHWNNNKLFFKYCNEVNEKEDKIYETIECSPIAIIKQSNKPISAIIPILSGQIMFIPKNNKPAADLILEIHKISSEIYFENLSKPDMEEKRPEWIVSHITVQERNTSDNIIKKELEISSLKKKLEKYRVVDYLLYGTGNLIENATKTVFEDFKLDYEHDQNRNPYDFLIKNLLSSNGTIYVEVTGEKKIKQGSRKMGQIMQILGSSNFDPLKDRIILLANCQRDLDPSKRVIQDMITPQAETILKNNNITIIWTTELFIIWKKLIIERDLTISIEDWIIQKLSPDN